MLIVNKCVINIDMVLINEMVFLAKYGCGRFVENFQLVPIPWL